MVGGWLRDQGDKTNPQQKAHRTGAPLEHAPNDDTEGRVHNVTSPQVRGHVFRLCNQ